jgi:hypothetical protein
MPPNAPLLPPPAAALGVRPLAKPLRKPEFELVADGLVMFFRAGAEKLPNPGPVPIVLLENELVLRGLLMLTGLPREELGLRLLPMLLRLPENGLVLRGLPMLLGLPKERFGVRLLPTPLRLLESGLVLCPLAVVLLRLLLDTPGWGPPDMEIELL